MTSTAASIQTFMAAFELEDQPQSEQQTIRRLLRMAEASRDDEDVAKALRGNKYHRWNLSIKSFNPNVYVGREPLLAILLKSKCPKLAHALIDNGAVDLHNPNTLDRCAHSACAEGNRACVELLAKRSDIFDFSARNCRGQTPLMRAAEAGNMETLASCAALFPETLDARDYAGKTALRCCVDACHVECAARLLSAGADPACPDAAGQTVLHAVAELANPTLCALFSSHPKFQELADMRDVAGRRALDIALANNDLCLAVLLGAGEPCQPPGPAAGAIAPASMFAGLSPAESASLACHLRELFELTGRAVASPTAKELLAIQYAQSHDAALRILDQALLSDEALGWRQRLLPYSLADVAQACVLCRIALCGSRAPDSGRAKRPAG